MRIGQREGLWMGKTSRLPAKRNMALLAVLRVPEQRVVWVRGPRQIRLVAGRTLGRGSSEVADLGARVAAEASDGGVRSDQREARAVVQCDRFARLPG